MLKVGLRVGECVCHVCVCLQLKEKTSLQQRKTQGQDSSSSGGMSYVPRHFTLFFETCGDVSYKGHDLEEYLN